MSKTSGDTSFINVTTPESVDTAVTNLVDKPTKAIGQTASDLWQFLLGGRISFARKKQEIWLAAKLEEYKKSIDEKVAAIPEEKRVPPSIQIAGQAIEDSKYCFESEELRELFANLIANSMNRDYSQKVHPSFSKIIQQLSPQDARVLSFIHQNGNEIAIADYIVEYTDNSCIRLFKFIPAIQLPNCTLEQASRSISSLQLAGLFSISPDIRYYDSSKYDFFKNTYLYAKTIDVSKEENGKAGIKPQLGTLTALGEDFVSVCLD